MHEVSLVASLVDVVTERAAGQPVAVVGVRRSSTIPEDVLRQAFAFLTVGGPLEHARLDVEAVDTTLACPACGVRSLLGHDDLVEEAGIAVCPACGEMASWPTHSGIDLLEVRLASG
jgi:Zn finger protein HypA/HybF involved in hydrogenase expression